MATNFFQRWSSRKLAARDEQIETEADELVKPDDLKEENSDTSEFCADDAQAVNNEAQVNPEVEGEATTPTLEDVAEVSFETGVASFMKSGVEKSVKKAALRKLFHSDEFNYISEMDDCTGDYSNLPTLDSDVSKQLRNWMDEVVDELEGTSEDVVEEASGEEAAVPGECESFPTSAESNASEKAQEKQRAIEEAEQEERSQNSQL